MFLGLGTHANRLKNSWNFGIQCLQDRRLPAPLLITCCRLSHRAFPQNYDYITLDITIACNLSCNQCNRSCANTQAPSQERMDLVQINRFVQQSIEQKKKWKLITVAGGEPTIHPQYLEIIETLRHYRDTHSNKTRIVVVTNGHGSHNESVLQKTPNDIIITNTNKIPKTLQGHVSFNTAPRDDSYFDNKDYSKGCIVVNVCGLGLTRHGYYACGPGAGIDRVLGFGLNILNLSEVTPERLMQQRKTLCSYCGHFKNWGIYKYNDDQAFSDWGAMSKSWKTAYSNYRNDPPVLKTY